MREGLVGLEIEKRGDVVVASLTGELDIAGAARTGERITDAVPTSAVGLVVDLMELEFMDSSGIAMLFGLARSLGSRRQRLSVAAPPDGPVWRVLEIVEFERAAPVHGDVDAAVAEIG
ncbi:MAG TPA: STAS domain-containing protein [Thermoleophilaceae bacterium]